ncbi:MAG: hypothetical protein ABR615_00900 [Pseudonocardiaceae bacterium]
MCTAVLTDLYCPECAELKAFEQPPCLDGHGVDCPERLCVTCGVALLIDLPVEPVARPVRTFGSRAA